MGLSPSPKTSNTEPERHVTCILSTKPRKFRHGSQSGFSRISQRDVTCHLGCIQTTPGAPNTTPGASRPPRVHPDHPGCIRATPVHPYPGSWLPPGVPDTTRGPRHHPGRKHHPRASKPPGASSTQCSTPPRSAPNTTPVHRIPRCIQPPGAPNTTPGAPNTTPGAPNTTRGAPNTTPGAPTTPPRVPRHHPGCPYLTRRLPQQGRFVRPTRPTLSSAQCNEVE